MRQLTEIIRSDPSRWAGMQPCAAQDIDRCERQLGRRLPADVRQFLRLVGTGGFSDGRNTIYTLDEVVACRTLPAIMLCGYQSLEEADIERLYDGFDRQAPSDGRFVSGGVNLLDVVQIGQSTTGYHVVGAVDSGIGYLQLVTDGIALRMPSFTEWLGACE